MAEDTRAEDRTEFASIPRAAKTLWIAAAGGHIAEAAMIDAILASSSDSLWVTFDTPQTRSLLAGRRVHFVNYVAPRDLMASLTAARRIAQIVRQEKFEICISTGSAVAALSLPLVAALGLRSVYIESLARVSAPSTTGRIMRIAPRVETRTQYRDWSDRDWVHEGSIVNGWRSVAADSEPVRSILVTLGTIRPYRFDRAIDAVLQSLRPTDKVVWQVGSTLRTDLPGTVRPELSYDELEAEVASADVVVTHAGVGTALQVLRNHKAPVLAIRSGLYGEHVDEHQSELARELISRGLAVALQFGQDNRRQFDIAARMRIERVGSSQEVPGR